jgi:glycine hydroxymethyltransferase
MHYFTRFCESTSERITSLVDMHWGLIRNWVHLIASACYPFAESMKALAEPMCVFPIEGLPGERYFPGTDVMDRVENRAEELVCRLFSTGDAYRATIQPHSGTQANQVVFNAVLNPGDVVLSLRPQHGGHISHTVLIGRRNPVIYYPLSEDARIDYRSLEALALEHKPKLIIVGGSACPREIDFASLGAVARRSGALLHADVSHTATFIAAGIHSTVVPHADFITFNMSKNLRGPSGGVLIYKRELHPRVVRGLFPETQGGPNENMMFAKLVTLEKLATIDLRGYASRMVQVARLMGRVLSDRGLNLVTGGTDSHLLLLDLTQQRMTGIEAERVCEQHRVLVNRNLVPGDRRKPSITSGIRLGTACITILEYSDSDVESLANWIADRLTRVGSDNPSALIEGLTAKYNETLLPSGHDSGRSG